MTECRVCRKQYSGSTMTKCAGTNNCKSKYHNFLKEQILSNQVCKQERFREHYQQNDHSRICEWEITITDHAETVKPLRQEECTGTIS